MNEDIQGLLQFERLLCELTAAFINIPSSKIDAAINHGLQRIGEFWGLDRAGLIQIKEKGVIVISHHWAGPNIKPVSETVLREEFPWIANMIARGESICFNRSDDLPKAAMHDIKNLKKLGTKSYLSLPIKIGGAHFGSLSLGAVHSRRTWSEEMKQRLIIIGETFAHALQRKHAEETLSSAFSEIAELKDQIEAERNYLREEIKIEHNFEDIVGQSSLLLSTLSKVAQVAPSDTTVLILGETGTGKELIARAIHHSGPRKKQPLIKVNCATLPANLIESELFGHEKGAFTGAHQRQMGRFELAHGATLFLDEIGELPLSLQPKLLRVLQDGDFERLGSIRPIHTDARIIAATNRKLDHEVKAGRFRKDLWYRLNAFPIRVPPLRNRKSDIALLAGYFLKKYNRKHGKQISYIHNETVKALEKYSWPGNIRELENVIERAVIHTRGKKLKLMEGRQGLRRERFSRRGGRTLAQVERSYIIKILKEKDWVVEGKTGAAMVLGLHPSTLRSRMKKLNITRPG